MDAHDNSKSTGAAPLKRKPSSETPKPSLIERIVAALKGRRAALKKEDPNVYPLW